MQFIRATCAALLLGLLLLPCTARASPFRELLAKTQQDISSQESSASSEDQSTNDENRKDLQSLSLKDGSTTPVAKDADDVREETNTKNPVSITQDARGDIPEVIVNLAPVSKPPIVQQSRHKKSPYCVQVQSSPHSPPQTICDHHSSALPQDTASLTHHDADPLHHLAQAAITSAALGAAAHTFYQPPEHQHVPMTMVPSYAALPAKITYHQPIYNPAPIYNHQQVYSSLPQAYSPQVYGSPQTHAQQTYSSAQSPQVYSSAQAQSPQVYSSVPVQNHPTVYSTPVYQPQPQTYSAPSYKPSAPSYSAPSTSTSSSQHSSSDSYRSASNHGAAPVIQNIPPSNYGSSSYNSQAAGGTTSFDSAPAYGNTPSYQSQNYASSSASHSVPSSYSSPSQHFSASSDGNVPQHSTSYGNQGASYSVPTHQTSNFIQNSPAYNPPSTYPTQSMSYPAPPISLTSNYGYQPVPFYNNPFSCPPPVYGHPGEMSGPQSYKLMPSLTAAGVTEKYRESESEKKDLKDSDVKENTSGRASDYNPSNMYHRPISPQKGGYSSTGQQNLYSPSYSPSTFHFQVPSAYNSQGYGGSYHASTIAYGASPSSNSVSTYESNPSYTPTASNYVQIPSYSFAPVNYATSSYAPSYSPTSSSYGSTYSNTPPTYSASYGTTPSYLSSSAYHSAPPYGSASVTSYSSPPSYSAAQTNNNIAPSYYTSSSYTPSYSPVPQNKYTTPYGLTPTNNAGVSTSPIFSPSYGPSSNYVPSYNPTYNVAPEYSAPSAPSYTAPSYSAQVAPSYGLVGTQSTAPIYGSLQPNWPQPYGPQSYYNTVAPRINYGSGSYGYGQTNNAVPLSISCQVQPIAGTQPQNYPNYRESETTQVQVTQQKDKDKSKDRESGSSEESHESTKTDGGVTTLKSVDDSNVNSTPKPDILPSIKQAIDQSTLNKDGPRTQTGGQQALPGGEGRPQSGTSSFAPTGRADQWSHQSGSGWYGPGNQGHGWPIMRPINGAPQIQTRYPAPPFPQFGPEYY